MIWNDGGAGMLEVRIERGEVTLDRGVAVRVDDDDRLPFAVEIGREVVGFAKVGGPVSREALRCEEAWLTSAVAPFTELTAGPCTAGREIWLPLAEVPEATNRTEIATANTVAAANWRQSIPRTHGILLLALLGEGLAERSPGRRARSASQAG